MQIRQANLDDIPVILRLIAAVIPAMRSAGNFQWSDHYPGTDAFTRDVELGQLWIAELDCVLAGVAAITTEQEPDYAQVGWDLDEPAIVVHRLAVDPVVRGKGVAASLMQQAEAVARTLGIAVLHVDTSTENEATQRLFPKLGYTLAGEISLRDHRGLRVLCYEKRLGIR